MDFQKIPQRSDETMLSLILSVANEDERIRAVTMNGSRANPNAPKDRYQDFDIVYFATDIKPFVEDTRWLDVFGERVIMQTPDDWNIFLPYDDPNRGKHFGFLMQFMDGNRIDLTVAQLSLIPELTADSETIVLLDKDHLLSGVPEASDRDYWAKKPDANHFYGTCNEFLWVSTYVAKGLARKEISFAKTCMEQYVRDALLQILEYYVGIKTDFSVSIGKSGKYLPKFLSAELWEQYLATYPDAAIEHMWASLFRMQKLFHKLGTEIAAALEITFPEEEYRRVQWYLQKVKDEADN